MIVFLIIWVCMLGMMLFRNNLVYNVRIRAIGIASSKAKKEIDEGKYNEWERFYAQQEAYGSYFGMLFDLRKWTYKQFYPGWE